MEIFRQRYVVIARRKVYKSFQQLPANIQERLWVLMEQMAAMGPVAHSWPNYSKLGENRYHCHLKYSYVACWTCDNNSIQIEVYYVGSREKAPY